MTFFIKDKNNPSCMAGSGSPLRFHAAAGNSKVQRKASPELIQLQYYLNNEFCFAFNKEIFKEFVLENIIPQIQLLFTENILIYKIEYEFNVLGVDLFEAFP